MKAQTVKEVLIATKWILEHTGWCQGVAGRDESGYERDIRSPDCVSRCLVGALWTVEIDGVLADGLLDQAFALLNDLASENIVGGAITFNDAKGRTKQEVLDLLDRVIERTT